jgi:YD repeat-containing protein
MTNAKGYTTQYLYDPCGNLISVIDPEGNQALYEYDPLGNLTKMIQGEGTLFSKEEETMLWEMDLEEVLKHNRKSKDLRVTTYKRDKAGQVEQINDSLGNMEKYTYDHSGKLIQKNDKDGYHTSYNYTSSGHLEQITYADGREVKLSYNLLRQLIQMEDWLGITRIETDALGRTVKVTDHKNREISYSWGPRA